MSAWQRRGLFVAATHPSAAGHFPGRSVIPGALLLDEAAQAIAGDGTPGFRAVKFLAPARHGEPLALHWRHEQAGLIRFEIRRAETDETVVSGTLETAA